MQEKLKNQTNQIESDRLSNIINSQYEKNTYKVLQKTDIIEVNLNTDYNEKLLDEVGYNLREINQNITETAVALKGQGDILKNTSQVLDGANLNIKKANVTLNSLSNGQRIQLILLNIIAFILFLGIIILLILRILKSN